MAHPYRQDLPLESAIRITFHSRMITSAQLVAVSLFSWMIVDVDQNTGSAV